MPMVRRSRLRSTTDEPPSDDETPPPNRSDSPPPLPLCSSTSRIISRLVMMSTISKHDLHALTLLSRTGVSTGDRRGTRVRQERPRRSGPSS